MACGLPVVALDTARLRWIVGKEEFLPINDNPATIAACIAAARNSSPAAQYERHVRAAAFSWRKIALIYQEFLQEVIAVSSKRQQSPITT